MKLHWRLIYTCGCSLLIGLQLQIPGCSNNVANSVDAGNLPAPTAELSGQQLCNVAKSITVLIMSADGKSEGTGFLIDQKPDNPRRGSFLYKVVTNAHVVTKGKDHFYQIQTSDGISHQGIQLFRFGEASSGSDLAILQFQSNKSDYTIAKLAPGLSLAPNQARVVAAGFPIRTGAATVSEWVCTEPGEVSFVLQRPMRGGYGIGYYLDIRKGMSGGPLLNLQGEVVGINGRHSNPPFGADRIYRYENGDAMTQDRDLLMRSSWAIPMDTLLPLARREDISLAYNNTPNQPAPPPNVPVAQQTPTPNQPEGEIQDVETPPPNVPVAQQTPTPNQPEGEIRFECVNIRGVPTTILTDGTIRTSIKQWYPGPGGFSNPQKRCEAGSQQFQYHQRLVLVGNITTERMNGENVLCVSLEIGRPCEGPQLLFTILPGKNPNQERMEITNRINQFNQQISANPRPATEFSPRPATDLGCGNAVSQQNYSPELERRAQKMLVRVLIGDFQRTGIVIKQEGQNYQVLTYAGLVGASYSIQTDDGSIIPALLSKTIPYLGDSLVVLDFRSPNIAYEVAAPGSSSSLTPGARVFTAGYSLAPTSSVSRVFQLQPGEIMPLPSSQPGNQRLAISNRVDEGGIGGPLLNCRGEVVGIVDRQNYVNGGWRIPSDAQPEYQYSWAIPIEQVYPPATRTNAGIQN